MAFRLGCPPDGPWVVLGSRGSRRLRGCHATQQEPHSSSDVIFPLSLSSVLRLCAAGVILCSQEYIMHHIIAGFFVLTLIA